VKDRHNANILIDGEGHVLHIDFGYILGGKLTVPVCCLSCRLSSVLLLLFAQRGAVFSNTSPDIVRRPQHNLRT
jgi:hypothetical protein